MSASSDKGRSLEEYIAKLLNKKLGAKVQRDKRSGAGSHQKMDINDFFQSTPLDIEAKNHSAVKIKEWFRQAKAGASVGRIPTVVFKSDDDVLAALPFEALVDLLLTIQQQEAEIERLSEPVIKTAEDAQEAIKDLKTGDARSAWKECRGGNLVSPGEKKCLVKTCTYCHPKKTKEKK